MRSKIFFRLTIFYILLFAFLFISFLLQEFSLYHREYSIGDSNIGNQTCTFIGDNHHLAWMFYGGHPDYHPNNLLYVISCTTSFIFYKKEMYGAWISWLLTLAITLLSTKWTWIELPAFWCLLSIISIPTLAIYWIIDNFKILLF